MGKKVYQVIDVLSDLTVQQKVTVLTSVLGALSEGLPDRGFILTSELIVAVERRAALTQMPQAQAIVHAAETGSEMPHGVQVVPFPGTGSQTKH